MKRLLNLKARVEILEKIIANTIPETDTQGVTYYEVKLEDLVAYGLPRSATNPAYWSGTSPGVRAAVAMNKTTFFSKKYEYIRFLELTPEDKAIWQERVATARHKAMIDAVDVSLLTDED